MSDLKHMTPAELRAEISSISKWRKRKESEAAIKAEEGERLLLEASELRVRAHNLGQREAWARIYLAQKS